MIIHGRHGGAVVIVVASQQEGVIPDPPDRAKNLYVCSLHVFRGFPTWYMVSLN